MNKRSIYKGVVLMLAGTVVTGTAYIPQSHKKPSPAVVAEYLGSHPGEYNPQKYWSSWQYSENRKREIQAALGKIMTIRSQIRQKAQDMVSINNLIETCARELVNNSNRHVQQMVNNRAKQLHVKPSAIKADVLRGMRMVQINLDEIV